MSSNSQTTHNDHMLWKRLYELLSHGFNPLLEIPNYGSEVNDLSNLFRANLSFSVSPFFFGLLQELFSLFPSGLSQFRQILMEIQNLDPILQEADLLNAHIVDISSQLAALQKEYEQTNRRSLQLQSYVEAATEICAFLSELAAEWENFSLLTDQLFQAESLVEHLFDLYQDIAQEKDDLVETIYIRTRRLAALEVQKANLQRDLTRHTHLTTRLNSLEIDLKIFVAKIGAYFQLV